MNKTDRLIKSIISDNTHDGVCFEKYLKEPIPFHNNEDMEIVRLIVDGDTKKLMYHAMDESDSSHFGWFDTLPTDIQDKIYNVVLIV